MPTGEHTLEELAELLNEHGELPFRDYWNMMARNRDEGTKSYPLGVNGARVLIDVRRDDTVELRTVISERVPTWIHIRREDKGSDRTLRKEAESVARSHGVSFRLYQFIKDVHELDKIPDAMERVNAAYEDYVGSR
tara:strand:+ start:97552 stop:97959 length:408 start_codon:yes stop_codon:yes gene_type:complete